MNQTFLQGACCGTAFVLFVAFFLFGVMSFVFGTTGNVGQFHDKVEACLNPT